MTDPIAFQMPNDLSLDAVVAVVRGNLRADPVGIEHRHVEILDTPDNRLAGAGMRLEREPASGQTLRWRLIGTDGRVRAETTTPPPGPRFADDLPAGPLRDHLEPIAWIRALVPIGRVDLVEERVNMRDRDGKIRVRLAHLRGEADSKTDGKQPIAARFRIEPLKGYGDDADNVARRLARAFGWPMTGEDPIGGIEAGAVNAVKAKPKVDALTPDSPAGPALRGVLADLLAVMQDRRPGVIEDIDSEFLHEYRVAMRRTRSAIQQLPMALPEAGPGSDMENLAEDFRWLSQETSPCRDLDVHILALKVHMRTEDADTARALAPLGGHLDKRKAKAHAALVKALRSKRYKAMVNQWRNLLEAGEPVWTARPDMRRPIGAVAGDRIVKLHRRVLKDGARIETSTPAEALHDLRKRMKKLRYVIEFVRDLYPKDDVKPMLRVLKDLQEVLGDVQDLEVQTEALKRFGRDMAEDGSGTPDTLMAIGGWAEDLERQRLAARDRFHAAFDAFAEAETVKRFRATFAPATKKGPSADASLPNRPTKESPR